MRARDTENRALTPDGSVSKRLCPCFVICSGYYNPMEKRVAERRAWGVGDHRAAGYQQDPGRVSGPHPTAPDPTHPRGPTRPPAPALPRGSNSCALPEHRMEGGKGGFAPRAPEWGSRRWAKSALVGTQQA